MLLTDIYIFIITVCLNIKFINDYKKKRMLLQKKNIDSWNQ